MGKHIFIEGADGISGDMTVAALLDLGADEQVLREALASLPLTGYRVSISRVSVSGIDCADFDVILETDNHDHDDAYLYGHLSGAAASDDPSHQKHQAQDHDHPHGHDHHHGQGHHGHHHGDNGEYEHHHDHHHGEDHGHPHHHEHDHVHRGLK